MTTYSITLSSRSSCDLLKIHYLCGWNDNERRSLRLFSRVVICSKFITFVVEMTTLKPLRRGTKPLWFAQNSLPLWLKWQLAGNLQCLAIRCDLLKIHYLCGWNDNENMITGADRSVVICSKFITFVVEMTTRTNMHFVAGSCDLLKIHYLCGWNDNSNTKRTRRGSVVICSKFITFVVEMTTNIINIRRLNTLWFAQNSLPLWLKWQLRRLYR